MEAANVEIFLGIVSAVALIVVTVVDASSKARTSIALVRAVIALIVESVALKASYLEWNLLDKTLSAIARSREFASSRLIRGKLEGINNEFRRILNLLQTFNDNIDKNARQSIGAGETDLLIILMKVNQATNAVVQYNGAMHLKSVHQGDQSIDRAFSISFSHIRKFQASVQRLPRLVQRKQLLDGQSTSIARSFDLLQQRCNLHFQHLTKARDAARVANLNRQISPILGA
jgi:hypothetical protein